MTKQEEREFIIREFLSRIEDATGAVRRYAKTLLNKPPWRIKEEKDEIDRNTYSPFKYRLSPSGRSIRCLK